MNGSAAAYLSVIFILLFFAVVWIVVFYAEPAFPLHSYVTQVIGYFAAFGILLVVPIDIAIMVHDRKSTVSGSDSQYNDDVDSLSAVYNTFFTMVLVLGSFVLVFQEYFNTDGYFTLGGKLFSSFKRMMFDTFAPLIVGVIILGILIGQHVVTSSIDALKLAAVLLTNTMYELGLMFLLGYALVEYPREIWSESDLDGCLLRIQQKAATDFADISEAQLSVSLAVSDVLKTKTQLASYADPSLAAAMDLLVQDCPKEFRSERMGKVATNKAGQITIDTLAQLRTRLNTLKDVYKMAQAKSESTKLRAYELEDIIAARDAKASVIHWSLTDKDSSPSELRWHTVTRPILYKIAAGLCAVLSILSFLGVVCSMHGVGNDVSLYFLAVHKDNSTVGGITIFILITLGYTVYIAFWAMTQMRISEACQLVPGSTTPEALSFNVRMVARLAAPLAFFYLGWISENGLRSGSWTSNDAPTIYGPIPVYNITTNTTTYINGTISSPISMPSAFSNFYQIQNVSAIQEIFGTVFPIILFVILALVAFKILNRLLVLVKLNRYQFGSPIITDEQLREGKRQLQRHKALTTRKFRRGELKNFISASQRSEESLPLLKKIFFFLQKDGKKDVASEALNTPSESGPLLKEPDPISGNLERKGGFSISGGGWKDVYAELRAPCYLHFYKDKIAADKNRLNDPSRSNDPSVHILDVKLIIDVRIPEKKGKDNHELELALGAESIKLKFKNAQELDRWKTHLTAWREYAIDYSRLYGDDVEANVAPQSTGFSSNPAASGGRDELDNIQVDEGEEDDDKGGKKSSSAFFSGFGKKTEAPPPPPPKKEDDKPKPIEGWVEKKGGGKMGVGADWQKRYLKVDESQHALIYSKSSSPSEKPSGVIDLRLVQDVIAHEKNGTPDYSRFNVDAGDKVYKFRAPNAIDGQRWIESLNAWRDYFLLNMS